MGSKIYICRIKILGFAFAVLDEELAKKWVDQDPEMHVYDVVPIKSEL
jgi:hypothetical protein